MALSNSMGTLIPHLLSAMFLIIAMANTAHTTSFDYDFTNGLLPINLIYGGDAYWTPHGIHLIKTDNSGNALPGSVGQLIYEDHIPFWESGKETSFESTVKFIVKPNANDLHPADGLVFFIYPSISTLLPTYGGGNFGIFGIDGNTSGVFAAEFDIYPNLWDPPYRHVGIDIESRRSVATAQISNDMIGKEVTMRVRYVGATKMIMVDVMSEEERYEVSYQCDLTTVLQKKVVVGISASTGANVATHDVLSWSLNSFMYEPRDYGTNIRQLLRD